MLRNAACWLVAIVLASLLPALVLATVAFNGRIEPGHATATAFGLAWWVALSHVLVLGVPVTCWLRWRRRFTWLRLVLAGFIAGLTPCALVLLLQSRADPAAMAGLLNPAIGGIVLAAGGFGALAALVMWGVLRLGLAADSG